MSDSAAAITVPESDFDDGTLQGWTVSPSVGFSLSNPGSGGNPGGYAQLADTLPGGSGGLAVAPLAFLGDLTGYASISWDARLPSVAFEQVSLVIANNTTEYTYTPLAALTDTWQSWQAPLDSASGWTRTGGPGSFANVIQFVTSLTFDLEVSSSMSNEAGLDNVRLNPIPLPAAVWLFGSGLLGLLGITKRGRQTAKHRLKGCSGHRNCKNIRHLGFERISMPGHG